MNMNETIYPVKNQFPFIIDEQIFENGEYKEDIKLNTETIEDDAISIASYIKNLEVEEAGINEAVKNMTERKRVLQYRIEGLKHFLQTNLQANNITEISTSPYFKIKIKKNPPKVEMEPGVIVPDEYLRTKTITEIDKSKISDELKNGVLLEFAKLTQSTRIEIK